MRILIYDPVARYTFVAEACAASCDVVYVTQHQIGFSQPYDSLPGKGLNGITVSNDLFESLRSVDAVVFCDVDSGGLQAHLRAQRIPVFGSGDAGTLELDRWKGREAFAKAGLTVPEATLIKGIDDLRAYLEDTSDVYVKLSLFRGAVETFHHEHPTASRQWLDRLALKLGPMGKFAEFTVEEPVEGNPVVEVGMDTFFSGGEYADTIGWGFESKDAAFAATTAALPEQLLEVADKMKPLLSKYDYRGAISNEVRITHDGCYMIDPCCFSADTEILTNEGWKRFASLSRSETVATLDRKTGVIEYQKPTAYQAYQFDGKLLNFTSPKKVVDFLVTPDHGLWARYRDHNGPLQYYTAKDMRGKFYIPRTGKWLGQEQPTFTLPAYSRTWQSLCGPHKTSCVNRSYEKPPLDIPTDAWIEFLGLYLSEGSCGGEGQVNIAQYKYCDEFDQILQRLPWKYSRTESGFRICDIQLADYLKQFGLCDKKFVPQFIKELTPRQIRLFLSAFQLGDGSFHKGQALYFTTSEKLADDIQELIFKAGNVASISRKDTKGTTCTVNHKSYTRNHDIFWISERPIWAQYYFEKGTAREEDYIKEVAYSGLVYDVTVPNGTIYVRRNGKTMWSSNCRFGSPPSQLQSMMIRNFPEVLSQVAHGEQATPDYRAPFGVQINLTSEAFLHGVLPLEIGIPERVAIFGHCKIDGQDYAVNTQHKLVDNLTEFGAACGWGRSWEAATASAIEAADSVKGLYVSYSSGKVEEILKTLREAKKLGIHAGGLRGGNNG